MTDAENERTPSDPTDRRAGYAAVVAIYLGVVGLVTLVLRRRGTRLPERISAFDLAVTALATQRAARLLAKEPITSPVRAPFTEFVDVSGPAELDERARDDSVFRHTVGELLTCPFCVGQWIATAFVTGHVVAPRATRLVTSLFAIVGVADALQHAVARLADRSSGAPEPAPAPEAAVIAAGGRPVGAEPDGAVLVEGPNSA